MHSCSGVTDGYNTPGGKEQASCWLRSRATASKSRLASLPRPGDPIWKLGAHVVEAPDQGKHGKIRDLGMN